MDKINVALAILIPCVLVILIPVAIINKVDRNKWIKEHCIKIGEVIGSTGFGMGISSNGSVVPTTTFIPGKIGYKCDNNITYWE